MRGPNALPVDVRLRNVRLVYDEFCDLDESTPFSGVSGTDAPRPVVKSHDWTIRCSRRSR